MKVFVVMDLNLGWDSISGIFSTEENVLEHIKDWGYNSLEDAENDLIIIQEKEVE